MDVRNARELLAARGRHGDTELAHISRGERNLMRAWQGHENINPRTGLPEYFSFKKIVKGIASAAGAIAGGYLGGPAGAALGGALGNKLTGGSWKSALGTGLLSGLSAYGLQQSGIGDSLGMDSLSSGADLLGRTGASSGIGALGGNGSSFDMKSLLPIAAVGIGALGAGSPKSTSTGAVATVPSYSGPEWTETTKPLDRNYEDYDDNYYTYGQDEGEHSFYDEVNPVTKKHGGGIGHFRGGGHAATGRDRGGPGGTSRSGPDRDHDASGRDARDNQFGGIGSGFGSGPGTQGPTTNRGLMDPSGVRAGLMAEGDPTTLGGMLNRRPSTLQGLTNIVNGVATPDDVAQVGMQGLGLVTGAPFGTLGSLGIAMGKAVKDVQGLRDAGVLAGETRQDPSMGRVDIVKGEGYSLGNPASDDRAENVSGLGGGMVGGHGGDDSGSQVLSTLAQTFPAAPASGGIGSMATPPAGGAMTTGRQQQAPDDYYTYGEKPEFEFFDQVNAARGGHIRGAGSGQDDKIPAMLSDGEYVWSAQDVSDLGDGSNDEGVRRLDKMRQLVRKQAGRKNHKSIAKPQRGIGSLLKEVA